MLLKNRLWHRHFSVNFAKILRTLFFSENPKWLLLKWPNHVLHAEKCSIFETNPSKMFGAAYSKFRQTSKMELIVKIIYDCNKKFYLNLIWVLNSCVVCTQISWNFCGQMLVNKPLLRKYHTPFLSPGQNIFPNAFNASHRYC